MVALCTELDRQLQCELLVELSLDLLPLFYPGTTPLASGGQHSVIGKAFNQGGSQSTCARTGT